MSSPKIEILDEDLLNMRFHANNIKNNKLLPVVFKAKPEGSDELSVDWNKYSTVEESRNRAKNPLKNGIGQFIVEEVRKLNYKVEHKPEHEPPNFAHSIISPVLEERDRLLLRDIFVVVLNPQEA